MTTHLITLILFLTIQTFVFYKFYTKRAGKKAVYHAWYAWIIDAGAIISGLSIMLFSLYLLNSPWIFTIEVPKIIFYFFTLLGSWQFGIHLTKFIIRNHLEL